MLRVNINNGFYIHIHIRIYIGIAVNTLLVLLYY